MSIIIVMEYNLIRSNKIVFLNQTKSVRGIHLKTRLLANSTTYKNHIIARRRFSLMETAESTPPLGVDDVM